MSELKPCPFCGDIPKPKPSKDECWWYECGCKTVIINLEEWNTRPIEDELRAEIARRDEIITRLKENAERLASTYVIEVFPHEWVCRGGCHHWARFGEQIDHAPDCPVTLHRQLMKELEGEK